MTLGYSKGNKMNTRKFFQNRCARLLPVFYLTNLLPVLVLIISAAPLSLIGWRSDALDDASVPVLNTGLTLFAVNSWLAPLYGISGVMPINAVTWTISTMGFFYMVFPCSECLVVIALPAVALCTSGHNYLTLQHTCHVRSL
jgi:peptidoglycan/LPS O-acetylase OafA/YrhL